MSVVRFGDDSDVYMYPCGNGRYECCGCHLAAGDTIRLNGESQAADHLREHRTAGHKVPEYAFDDLRYREQVGRRAVRRVMPSDN